MRAWARPVALGLLLTAAIPTAAALAANSAEDVLLDKANYWRLKDRADLAAEALNQLLTINPNQPEALFQYGMLEVQQNKTADAQRYLAKLKEAAPDSPHIADLQNAIRTGQVGTGDLGEARRLAQAGQLSDAVQKYQQIFRGPPPPSYGVEYYMTLGGTPQGWDEARQGLERLSRNSPNDAQLKLALAQLYTYREPTRMEGIGILAQLSKNPVVGGDAVKAWHQALTWLGGNPQSKAAYEQYLAQYPKDAEIGQLLADLAKQPALGPGSEAQSQAYEDLKQGKVAAAERQFQSDLQSDPNDPQALAGLGLVRLRQQRFTEARDLLARAIHAAPDQQKDLSEAYDSAVFWSRVQEAKGLAAHRNYAAAASLLNGLLAHGNRDNWGAELVLADIELKQQHYAAAEAAYRRALRARPGNPDAALGLASALRAQNKTAELNQLTARMSPAERARFEKAASGGSGGEALKLRNEAKTASANNDVALATAKFQAAIAADPKDPWIRLDYARFLAAQNNMNGAFAAVDPAASGNSPTSVLVSAMFDAQQDRWVQALDKIDKVPPGQRTEEMRNFRDRIYARATIERAKEMAASGNVEAGRKLLVSLYNDPHLGTDERRLVLFVVVKDLHDYQTGLRMAHDAYMRGGPNSARFGTDYAMLLLSENGHEEEAAAIMAQVNSRGHAGANDEQVTPININLAIRQADKLRDKGDYAGAWDQISQLLTDNPDDPGLLLAAGRIYASSGRAQPAMEYFDKAYQQDSGNLDTLRGVITGAIMAHEYGQASDYLDKGFAVDPQNPWLFYLKAQVERARGNNGAAIEALMQARALNKPQPATSDAASGGAANAPSSAPTPLTPGTSPATPPPPPNPFRHSQATPPRSGFRLADAAEGGDAPVAQQREVSL